MRIRNADAIARGSKRRSDGLSIVEAGIDAVLPEHIIKNALRLDGNVLDAMGHRYDLSSYKHIYVAGGGKASGTMAVELEKILDGRITAGIVNDRYGVDVPTKTIKINHAGHPLPTEDGIRGVREMIGMLSHAVKDDLIIFLISGGGSALLPCPAKGISLEDNIRLTDLMLKSGMKIAEMNVIRKHVSRIKGGRLLRYTHGAAVLSLIVSDVVGDDVSFIASGPTAPDDTTYADAIELLKKYGLYDIAPKSVIDHLTQGDSGKILETPKSGDPLFKRVTNLVIASNIIALKAAAMRALELGYKPLILGACIIGESREVGLVLSGIARECLRTGNPFVAPVAIISGGETTVTIKGKGRGGRNQEFVLGFLRDYTPGTTVISVDTDGIDGASDACGAIADETTLPGAEKLGLSVGSALKDNASYDFFHALGDLIFTGPTGTNVSDLRIILVYK
jgi:glycerate-2-kinase